MSKLKEPRQINILTNRIDIPADGTRGIVGALSLNDEMVTTSHIENLLINMMTNLVVKLNSEIGFVNAIHQAINHAIHDKVHDDLSPCDDKNLNTCFMGDHSINGIEFGVRIMVGHGMDIYSKDQVIPTAIPVMRMDLLYSPDKPLTEKVWE